MFKIVNLISVIPPIKSKQPMLNHDCHQTDISFVISIYTKRKGISCNNVTAEISNNQADLKIVIFFPSDNSAFVLRYHLSQQAALSGLHPVRVSPGGKVEVTLSKKHAGEHWSSLGREEESRLCRQSELETVFRPWIVSSRREVTHDVDHLVLEPPSKAEVPQIKVN